MFLKSVKNFFKLDVAAGVLLALAAVLALITQNSPFGHLYNSLLELPVAVKFGNFAIDKPLLLWINDGLMAIFFLLVGLEIKREILIGELSSRSKVALPAIAALGGVIFPALIYSYINFDDSVAMNGWAIPAATDIAFALGVLTLLGNRVPNGLKVCLVAIAIIDDLAAIVIIALFYSHGMSLIALGLSFVTILALALLNYKKVTKLAPYMIIGIVMWVFVLKSGVHATLAGVILAMFIPINLKDENNQVPLTRLEHGLHSWVNFLILPIFAFANAGLSLKGFSVELLSQPITLGIILGLFFGKQIGVMLFTRIGMMLKICSLPEGVNLVQYYGMALLTGIGFTMSLFIGSLAFEGGSENQTYVRLGVLVGSTLSGVLGYLFLTRVSKKS